MVYSKLLDGEEFYLFFEEETPAKGEIPYRYGNVPARGNLATAGMFDLLESLGATLVASIKDPRT